MLKVRKRELGEIRVFLQAILAYIGDDPSREGLEDTPDRVIRSWEELYGGYGKDPGEELARTFESSYNGLVLEKDIEFYSTCEHHMLPFFGLVHIGYVPDGRVVGLSKLARTVEIFARRLQIQEQMTEQIADAIEEHLRPKGVAVTIEAQHYCQMCRGIKKQKPVMVTTTLRGNLREDRELREEFKQTRGFNR